VFAVWLVAYVVLVNLGETYVGANLLPWTVMTVVAGQSLRASKGTETKPDSRSAP
jgi:hypothetical protein